MPQPVIIEDYNPAWATWFVTLSEPVAAVLGDLAVRIEHVGSTAVVGLAAKPIIDIDAVIRSRDELWEAVRRLARIGYVHEGDLGIPDREAFDPPKGLVAHHLYVCSATSPELDRHRRFRDFLREHPEDASAYGDLKRTLATRFRDDREGYALAKSDFVNAILARAR